MRVFHACGCVVTIVLASAAAEPDRAEAPMTSSKVTYQCPHVGEGQSLTIDGKLDDAAWQRAKPMTDFTIVRTEGKKAEWKTTARLVWDQKNLYLSFECAIDDIRTTASERDAPVWEGESAEMFICPRGADAVYYEINFTPKNVIYDSRVESWKYDDQVKNWQKWAKSFNADIQSATQVKKDKDGQVTGWALEAAIPFKDLDVANRKAPAAGATWLFNVFRVANLKDGKQELSHWQPVKPEFHRPHQFPRLEFVDPR